MVTRAVILIALLSTAAIAQSFHILPCTGNHSTGGICWGWATGRSFGRDTLDAVCNPATMLVDEMNTTYFTWVPHTNNDTLRAAKIIGWGQDGRSHVAFKEGYDSYSHLIGVPRTVHRGSYSDVLQQASSNGYTGGVTGYYREEMAPRMKDLIAKNKFADDTYGGKVIWGTADTANSPSTKAFLHGSLFSVTRVTGQVSGQNIRQSFTQWKHGTSSWSTATMSSWVEVTTDPYQAEHKNLYDVQFQYSKPTGTFSGSIIVNGQSYSTPTGLFEVASAESLVATASTYFEFENVGFHFSTWSPTGSTSSTSKFGPTGTSQLYTVTANFSPIPKPPANLTAGGNVGDPVRVTWTSHSASSGVTEYQIWRKVKPKNQQEGTPQLLTTVPRTTTSYTDNAYTVTSGYTDDLVSYDVRARYNAGGVSAYANPNYVSVFAAESWKVLKQGKSVKLLAEPSAFALSAQPNPFNPTTQIIYEVPEPATVKIEIFDIAGRRLTELVNSDKSSGSFTILWDGRDGNRQAASGVYYCRMTATPSSGGEMIMQTVRLLLLK